MRVEGTAGPAGRRRRPEHKFGGRRPPAALLGPARPGPLGRPTFRREAARGGGGGGPAGRVCACRLAGAGQRPPECFTAEAVRSVPHRNGAVSLRSAALSRPFCPFGHPPGAAAGSAAGPGEPGRAGIEAHRERVTPARSESRPLHGPPSWEGGAAWRGGSVSRDWRPLRALLPVADVVRRAEIRRRERAFVHVRDHLPLSPAISGNLR